VIGDKKILTIVTARGGSKGIPGKNYRDLCGYPLFMWSMLASLESKYIDATILSSNCDECLRICEQCAGEVDKDKTYGWIVRPDEYATDLSKNEDALIHALKFLNEEYDVVINLQPTSPCRLDGLLDRSIEAYYKGGYDSLLTAGKDTPFIWQKIDEKWEYTVDKNPSCERKMRQEFDENEFIFHDNGNIYLVESEILLDTECRIGYNPCVVETSGINNIQIDQEFDFLLISKLLESMKLERPI
jgi:CMP-N,N'-diacetyllegionaminic acid synthase